MTLDITKGRFEEIVHAATSSRTCIFEAVTPYIDEKAAQLERILLAEGIAAMAGDAELEGMVEVCACTGGFILAVGHLDLVLTESGFGVVSNDHVAPASSERVRNLENTLHRAYDRALCDVLQKLTAVPGWGARPAAAYIINQPVYHIAMAENLLGMSDIDSMTWARVRGQLFDASFKLEFRIGSSVMDELLAALRTDSLTDIQAEALWHVRNTMAVMVKNDDVRLAASAMNRLVGWFEDNAADFDSFTSDKVYKARHAERFRNEDGGKAFFFG